MITTILAKVQCRAHRFVITFLEHCLAFNLTGTKRNHIKHHLTLLHVLD